jgi:murein DD-endopeptidase MepM/ murein hydrolase activator NlpD
LASEKGDWGNLIVITHRDGFQTWYAHLAQFSVKEGQEVRQGVVIGHVGTTGRSTGPHLHFEIKQDGQRLDPIDFLKP